MSLTLGPVSSLFHKGGQATTDGRRLISKSESSVGLKPLLGLVRHPLGTLASAASRYNAPADEPPRDSAAYHRQARYLDLKDAETYAAWKAAATELDILEDNEAWKETDTSDEYDYALIKAKIQELEDARLSCDVERLLFLVRTSLTRGLGHMGQLRLYKHSHIGTKKLIERYIESAQEAIAAMIDIAKKQGEQCLISPLELKQELFETRQSFGRTALLLSGGGTLGMNHIGVIRSLWEARLLPRIVSGASAGSIVGAVLCIKTDAEIPQVLEDFCYGNLDVFGKPKSLFGLLKRVLKYSGAFDIVDLEKVMKELLGDITFREAYNRTQRILNIPVSSSSQHGLPSVLNFLTAPNVMVWSAVCTSCSVPFVYTASSLLAKNRVTGEHELWDPIPETTWIDGSVDNDLPMERLSDMFSVNHFIVSQVNPHVVPWMDKEEQGVVDDSNDQQANASAVAAVAVEIVVLVKNEVVYRLQKTGDLGILPYLTSKISSVLTQQYSGDITIFPGDVFADIPRVLSNPTQQYMLDCMIRGQRATWPKLARIKNHYAIEQAIQRAYLEATAMAMPMKSQPISRPQSAGELHTQVRPSSLHKTSFSDPIPPTSPAISRTAPSSPAQSRRRTVKFTCDPEDDLRSPDQPRRSSQPQISLEDIEEDYFASSSSGPDEDPDSGIPEPHINLSPSPAPSPSLPPMTSISATNSARPIPIPIATSRERHAFIISALAMTPASSENPAIPIPAMAAMPSSPERRYKSQFHPPGLVVPDPDETIVPSSSNQDARPIPQIHMPNIKSPRSPKSPSSPKNPRSPSSPRSPLQNSHENGEASGLGLSFFN